MASDPGHAYPYRPGWRVVGCGAVLFGTLGAVAIALIPIGWAQLQAGRMPIGVAMVIGGLFGVPMVFTAITGVASGVRNAFHPPLLRLTPAALLLPDAVRGEPETDEDGLVKPGAGPPHPAEIPLPAVRRVRREGPIHPGSHKLLVAHDLAREPLVIEQAMMRPSDFDELEAALRAAIPAAFGVAPPP